MYNKCYIASPFFNEEQIRRVKLVEEVLKFRDVNFFSPRTSNLQGDVNTEIGRKAVFLNNEQMMDRADFTIVITNDKDMGTIFEAGYMYRSKKPIIYLFENGQDLGLNLMLSQSSNFIAYDRETLFKAVDKLRACQFYDEDAVEIKNNRGDLNV